MVVIYTDGACFGNPGPGGWGAIIYKNKQKIILSGYKKYTTNNEMELMAIKESLLYFSSPITIDLHSDSKYCVNGITTWMHTWKNDNWKKKNGTEIKNLKLWKIIFDQYEYHNVTIHWVKAHANNKDNNEVDLIAKQEIYDNFKNKND